MQEYSKKQRTERCQSEGRSQEKGHRKKPGCLRTSMEKGPVPTVSQGSPVGLPEKFLWNGMKPG